MSSALETPAELPPPPPRKRIWQRLWFWILAGFVVILLIAMLSSYLAVRAWAEALEGPYGDRAPIAFTQAAWRAAAHDWEGARYLMLDDLRASVPLVGMQRDEVEALLGPLRPPTEYPGGAWCYYLGPEPSLVALDNIWLGFELDAEDLVVSVSTFTD